MTTIIRRQPTASFILPLALSMGAVGAHGAELWLHAKCEPLPTQLQGPFVRLPDGGILGIDVTEAVISRDEGKTWEKHPIFKPEQNIVVSRERAIVCTKKGTVIVGFMNYKEKVWKWNKAKRDADPGTKIPAYIVRSTDGGKTWLAPQKLHDTWTGDARDMIQTASGRVVFSSMNLLHNPGRHSVLTYVSADDGETWIRSNTIDLGGNGHHGGVTEATIEQLRDGRVWMLLRTNWELFWEAFSLDEGKSWRIIRPSKIDASSSPGMLKRLDSGRLVLIWNRPLPEGKTDYPRIGGKGQWSEVPVRNHRGELSIMFSEDDGATWSKPVVFAKKPGEWLAYPHIFEAKPGVMWVTTMQGGIRVILRESDFLVK